MAKPLVSIIIPAYNEEKVIECLLASINNQSYPRIESIVIDDSSTDGTFKTASRMATVAIKRKHAERSIQRNFGASKAHGQYLMFLDADMELTSDVVSECVQTIQKDSTIGAIAIPELPIATNHLEKIKAFERSFYSDFGDPDTDAARFFPKKIFDQIGGYDTSLTGPEDWDLPENVVRKGYKVGRISSRIKHYERIRSILHLLKKKYYYGISSHRYFKKHKLSLIGPKTIYFLRPIFYKNWQRLVQNPGLTVGMIVVLTLEQFFGGLGYLVGRITKA